MVLKMDRSELSTGKSPQDEVRFLFAPIQVVHRLLDLPISWSLASHVLHFWKFNAVKCRRRKWSKEDGKTEQGIKREQRENSPFLHHRSYPAIGPPPPFPSAPTPVFKSKKRQGRVWYTGAFIFWVMMNCCRRARPEQGKDADDAGRETLCLKMID